MIYSVLRAAPTVIRTTGIFQSQVQRSTTELQNRYIFANKNTYAICHFNREYREKTTPPRMFLRCNLSSYRVKGIDISLLTCQAV